MSVKTLKVEDYENSTELYFDEIKDLKALSKEEERELWYRFHYYNDMSAREQLIKANLKFVTTVAKQFKGCGLPFADLVEEGNIGLINAIDRFTPDKDTKIISYAVWWIRKRIIEAIEKKGVLDTDNLDDIIRLSKHVDEDNNTPIKIVVPEKIDFEDTPEMKFNVKQVIEELFEGVPERERYIVYDYYGLDGDKPKTLDEIGSELNLTKERVRQLNEKALKKMRSNALIKNISFNGF